LIFTKFLTADDRSECDILIFRKLKERCYGKQFLDRIGEIGLLHFHSTHWRFDLYWRIATPM